MLTGGPGAAPGGVASKNGWVYMRVQGGFNFLWLYSSLCVRLCILPQNGGFLFKKKGFAKGCAFAAASSGIYSTA